MTWTADTVYSEGLDLFSSVVERFPASGWDGPSPCAGWRALDVLGHVGSTTRYGIDLLAGGSPAWKPTERPGDFVEGDPAAWWAELAGRARKLVRGVDLSTEVDTPGGRRTVAEGLSFPALDLFVHAWDLAHSAGTDVDIPAEVVTFTHSVLDRLPPEQLRGPGVFAPAVPPADDANPTDRFIAWTGRDPRWPPD